MKTNWFPQSFDQLWFSVESTPIFSHKSFFDGFSLQNWAKFTSLSWSICMHDWHLFFYSFSNCSRFVDVESTASYQLIFKGWYWQLIFNAGGSCVEIMLLIQLLTFNYFSTGVSFSTDSQQLPTWVEKLLNHGCWIYVEVTNDLQHIAGCWNTQPIFKDWWNSVVNVLQN